MRKLPVVFFCTNNPVCLLHPVRYKWRSPMWWNEPRRTVCRAEIVDGNDVAAVYLASPPSHCEARSGEGPTFLEFKTMRMHGHSEHDAATYVPRTLLDDWKTKDPILRAEQLLMQLGYGDDSYFHEVGERARKTLMQAPSSPSKARCRKDVRRLSACSPPKTRCCAMTTATATQAHTTYVDAISQAWTKK